MKKIYTLIVCALLAFTMSASAQRVVLNISENYEVKIDGRNYGNNATIPALSSGQHTAQLYQVERGFLGIGKKRTLVSTQPFEIRNNDVAISVDQSGQLRINNGSNYGKKGNRNNDQSGNDDYNKGSKQHGKGYGPDNNPGRGNKYGHNKKGKDKKNKHDNDDDHDD